MARKNKAAVLRLAFSYKRFSDPKQKKGRSLARQLRQAEKWVRQQRGMALDTELKLTDEGLSGYTGDHVMKGDFGKFIALCGTPRVPPGSVLIIEDFDRFSRQVPDDAWELFRSILLTGVEIVCLSMGRWFTKESLNNFECRVIVQAAQHRAHQESKMKAERLRDVWKHRRRRARLGKRPTYTRVPAWCKKVGKRVKPELIAERAAVIREMARLVMEEGLGCDRVAIAMQEGRWACWQTSGSWEGWSVHHVLTSPAVWGAYQPRRYHGSKAVPEGEVVRGHYPAVLTEEEARAIRNRLQSRKKEKGRAPAADRSCLRRLVKDAETGTPLHLRPAGKRKSDGHVHVYLDRLQDGGRAVVIAYQLLEDLVLRLVNERAADVLAEKPSGPAYERLKAAGDALDEILERKESLKGQIRRARPERMATLCGLLADVEDEEEVARGQVEVAEAAVTRSSGRALNEAKALIRTKADADQADQPALRRKLNVAFREVLEGVWVYRQTLGDKRAAVYVQAWFKGADCPAYAILMVGKPPPGWLPLDLAGVDLRAGYPFPLPTRHAPGRGT